MLSLVTATGVSKTEGTSLDPLLIESGADDTVNNKNKDVPSILLDPVAVTKDNIKEYTGEVDFPKVEEICAGKLAAKCKEIGLQ